MKMHLNYRLFTQQQKKEQTNCNKINEKLERGVKNVDACTRAALSMEATGKSMTMILFQIPKKKNNKINMPVCTYSI